MPSMTVGISALAAAGFLCACAATGETMRTDVAKSSVNLPTLDGDAPLVIAHRGASGHLPEHTLEAYALAIDQGADVIEPDLVFTKDGVLVARHDRYLSTTTDVASRPAFAARRRANDDAEDTPREDWWTEDFTLAELKTLRARQPFPGRSKEFDGLYEVPTFAEVLALVARMAKDAGRPVGVYPETKHPAFFAAIGMKIEAPLLKALESFDAGPVFIQSFEREILKRLKGKTTAKLVQLVFEEKPGAGPNIPLAEIAAYADGVGPARALTMNMLGAPTGYIAEAHALGLVVHPWTFRDDDLAGYVNRIVIADASPACRAVLTNDAAASIYSAFAAGADGVFADFPDTAVKARDCRMNTAP